MFLMPEQALFELCKCFIFLTVPGRHIRSVFIEILISSSPPGTFGDSQHVRIKDILVDDLFFRLHPTVVPDSEDDTRHIVAAFGMAVDITHK